MKQGFFVIGKRYTNRIGTYEVLDIQPDGMRVRYDSGTDHVITDLGTQERIVRNVRLEAESVMPYPKTDARNTSFFRTLGFLASRARIEAIVPARSQQGFEEQYEKTTGRKPIPGRDMYYLHADRNVDKWGTELRISFEGTAAEISVLDFGSDIEVVNGMKGNECRINNNRFIWRLFTLGFRLGDRQDLQAILSRIPAGNRADFRSGTG